MGVQFLFLIVALTLPSLSLQALPNNNNCGGLGYIDRDITVGFEVSELVRSFINGGQQLPTSPNTNLDFLSLLQQIGAYYTDVELAFGQAQRVGLVYAANTVEQLNAPLFSPNRYSQTTPVNGWPRIQSRSGAYLRNNLQYIVANTPTTRRTRPLYMVLIFATPQDPTHYSEVDNLINTLNGRNIHVKLIAVNPTAAAADSQYNPLGIRLNTPTCTQTQSCTLFRGFDISRIGQLITDITLQCSVIVRDPLCNDCILRDGTGIIKHDDCDKFVKCILRGSRVEAFIVQCPYGTLFDESKTSCVHAKDFIGSCNWCVQDGDRHPFQDNCAAYWYCNATNVDRIEGRCCPPGQRFDTVSRQCVSDQGNTCDRSRQHYDPDNCHSYYQCSQTIDTLQAICCPDGQSFSHDTRRCVPTSETHCKAEFCDVTRVTECIQRAVDDCNFRVGNSAPIRCGDGTVYNQARCGCVHPAAGQDACFTDRTGPNVKCDGNVLISSVTNTASWVAVDRRGASPGPNNVGMYSGSGGLSIPFLKRNRWATSKGVWGAIDFADAPTTLNTPAGTEVLLANTPCEGTEDEGKGASIYAYVSPDRREIVVGLRLLAPGDWSSNETPLEVTLSAGVGLPFTPDTFKTLTFFFDGRTLTAQVTSNGQIIASATDSVPTVMEIASRSCDWKIGFDGDNPLNRPATDFAGRMQRVELHWQCYSELSLNSLFD